MLVDVAPLVLPFPLGISVVKCPFRFSIAEAAETRGFPFRGCEGNAFVYQSNVQCCINLGTYDPLSYGSTWNCGGS